MGKEKKRDVTPFRHFIKHMGFVDINKLIKEMEEWLKARKYEVWVKGITHKVKSEGNEIEYNIEANKKISPYLLFRITCEIWLLRGRAVTMEKESSTKTGRSGKLEIHVTATMVKDYNKYFDKANFTKFLREIYERYIIESYLSANEGRIYVEGEEFVNVLKDALESFK